jgi:hypothetical protein
MALIGHHLSCSFLAHKNEISAHWGDFLNSYEGIVTIKDQRSWNNTQKKLDINYIEKSLRIYTSKEADLRSTEWLGKQTDTCWVSRFVTQAEDLVGWNTIEKDSSDLKKEHTNGAQQQEEPIEPTTSYWLQHNHSPLALLALNHLKVEHLEQSASNAEGQSTENPNITPKGKQNPSSENPGREMLAQPIEEF